MCNQDKLAEPGTNYVQQKNCRYNTGREHHIFFCGGWGSNTRPYIYYALSLPDEISSRGQSTSYLHVHENKIISYAHHKNKNNFIICTIGIYVARGCGEHARNVK